MQVMAQYFSAYRIDHILGFFRIWEIPGDCVTGLLGRFRCGCGGPQRTVRQRSCLSACMCGHGDGANLHPSLPIPLRLPNTVTTLLGMTLLCCAVQAVAAHLAAGAGDARAVGRGAPDAAIHTHVSTQAQAQAQAGPCTGACHAMAGSRMRHARFDGECIGACLHGDLQ